MNQYRQEYNEKKERVLNLLELTKQYYDKYEKKHEVEVLNDIIKFINDGEFSIVVVGEFSAGKSTFLNALMGEKLLPSFTRETTATINYLRHKDRAENGEEGRVYFSDGSVEILDKVDLNTISKYVSTESNLDVARKVEHLDLFLDSKFLEGNITLVDSPGLNGVADGHRELTEAQIEKSSASIFMFKADQPGSDTDFKFIGEIKDKVNSIIFALNKIDEIKASEGETPQTVIDSLKKIYKDKFPKDIHIPEIWGISAYPALVARSNQVLDYHGRNDYSKEEKEILEEQSKMNEFEDRLWQFLTKGEKAKAMLLSPVNKIVKFLSDSRLKIEEEINLLNGKDDKNNIEEKILEIQTQINEINNNIDVMESDIEDRLDLLINELEESIGLKLEDIKEKQISKLYNWKDIDELLSFESNIINDAKKSYKKVINKCEKEFINGVKEIISDNYTEVSKNINNSLKEVKFKVLLETEYEYSELHFKLGIKDYEKKIKDLEEKLNSKEQEIENIDKSILTARRLERQREDIRRQILNAENQKENYMNIMGPSKERETVQEYEKKSRGGIFGTAIDFIKGEKEVLVTKTKVINEDDIKEFKEYKQKMVSNYEKKIEDLNNKLNKLGEKNIHDNSDEDKKQILADIKKIENSIRVNQDEFKKNYIKQNKIALRKKKYELESYFDEINQEYSDKLYNELHDKKMILLDLIKSSISSKLNLKLKEKNDELILLQNKLNYSVKEKQDNLEKLNTMLEESENILMNAIELETELEQEPVDKIQEILL